MSRIEEELRMALAEEADATVVPPDAWLRQVERHSARRLRVGGFSLALATAAAVAVVVAIVAVLVDSPQRVAVPVAPPANGAPYYLVTVSPNGTASGYRSADGSSLFGGRAVTAVTAYGDGERVLWAGTGPDECSSSLEGVREQVFADGSAQSAGLRIGEVDGRVTSMAMSPDQTSLALGLSCPRSLLAVRDLATGRDRTWTTSANVRVRDLTFGADGRVVFSIGRAPSLWVLDTREEGTDFLVAALRDAAGCVLSTPAFRGGTGELAVARSCGGRTTVALLDPSSGAVVETLAELPAVPSSLDFDASGRHLLAAVPGHGVLHWDGGETFSAFPNPIEGSQAAW